MGTLYVVATPIGNLEDITFRAVRILHEVDLICCEDTRHTRILLDRYKIAKPLISYHQHSKLTKIDYIISELKLGKNIALVSDAGIPGINDPGGVLVEEVIKYNSNKVVEKCHSRVESSTGTLRHRESSLYRFPISSASLTIGNDKEIKIVPIPGPSAITTLLSVSGIPADKFLHLGYLPKKKGRQTLLKNLRTEELKNFPIVIYESPFRIAKTLEDFKKIGSWRVVIGRELTKKFEEIWRGEISDAIKYFSGKKPKGEFVICLMREQK